MPIGVRVFITLLFSVIAVSFLATTTALVLEFSDLGWLSLAAFYSHLFLFFPTFGIVTLLAFYTPACVFTHMYWTRLKFGKLRFLLGFIVVASLSFGISQLFLASPERSIWEVRPELLAADRGEPSGCADSGTCVRMPVLTAVENVRKVSQSRTGLAELSRNCSKDPLILSSPPNQPEQKRFCFASTPLRAPFVLSTDEECCQAQRAFVAAVNNMAGAPTDRSMAGLMHMALLPLKVFFLLMMLAISILLAVRRSAVEKYYGHQLRGIERGVLIGAAAMIIYPIMSHAFLHSAALLYGTESAGGYRAMAPMVSFAFGLWGLLLLFFFYRRRDKELQALARMGGIAGGAVAVAKYDQIIDWFVRIFGSGASYATIGALGLAVIGALVLLYFRTSRDMDETAEDDDDLLEEA
jgi:hypothetical protein